MSDETRVAVVTGASRGIGRATVELFRREGVRAIGLARGFDDSESTRKCDVTDEREVASVFAELMSVYGRLDILVNCAAITSRTDPLSITVDEWEAIYRTNVIGTYLCTREAIRAMKPRKYGKVVNVSSIAGRSYSRTASAAYTCSKYAVIGLTRHLAAHFGSEGINVNCVCPAQTRTETLVANVPSAELDALATTIPLGRIAEPDEIAQAILFLASDAASYLNGAIVDINGGQL